MKQIIIGFMLLSLAACTNKEVRMTDPNLEIIGIEVHYMGEPFTGTLVQQIPLTESEVRIEYADGIPKTPSIKD